MKDTATLLYEWRQHRLKLKDNFNEENLQNAMDWWNALNPRAHGFDFDHLDTWPDVWEYITEGFYTVSGNGLGMFYTVLHADETKDVEIWAIHDLLHTDMYLIAVVDGYVLNRMSGKVENLEDVKSDLNILAKHTKDEVITELKYSRGE